MLRVMSGGCSELIELTLAEASAKVRDKSVSPTELTQACLTQIHAANPLVNAFITVTEDDALRHARALESELAHGIWRGPLHGIPIALKDLIDTAGIRTTAASAVFKDRVPLEDAEVVRRLKHSGAILLGKLNLHEFAYGGTSGVTHFGPVRNPWNPAFSPGGSSGGSGAAVAARMCFGALGTDTAASIRTPASCCGIVGLKPTFGRVSTRGVIPLSWSLDHVGPMCRTVDDAALMLQAMADFEPRAGSDQLSKLRIGLPLEMYWEGLDPEIEAAAQKAVCALNEFTAGSREMRLPAVDALTISGAEAYAFHEPYLAQSAHLYSAPIRDRLLGGGKITASAYICARREMERWRNEIGEVFSDVDLIVTPTVPIKPVPAGTIVDMTLIRNTSAFNVFGLPTISIPCGFTSEGLPIGLQIAGPHLDESRVFLLARAYEQSTGWFKQVPKS
jgi:aspartyl-tRNA(Asn)/glutamyl-tRNA(Gln) amidotransferase subunit A